MFVTKENLFSVSAENVWSSALYNCYFKSAFNLLAACVQYATQEWTADAWKMLENLKGCKHIVDLQWVNYNSYITTVCTASPISRGIFPNVDTRRQGPIYYKLQLCNKFWNFFTGSNFCQCFSVAYVWNWLTVQSYS